MQKNLEQFTGEIEQGLTPKYQPADYSDAGNADAFVRYADGNLVFCQALGWLAWNGMRWEREDQAAIAKGTAFTWSMLDEATEMNREAQIALGAAKADLAAGYGGRDLSAARIDAAEAGAYLAWSKQSRNAGRIRNMLELAKPEMLIRADVLDADPFDLNTPAGIVDLKTGEIRPHDRGAFCTKMTAVAPGEPSDFFDQFLEFIACGDPGLMGFLQQMAGMALIGGVYQEGIVIAYGSGRNGKSSFFNALASALGDYAGSIDVSALTTERQNRGASLATLRGKRLVITGELEEGARLSVSTLKRLASTDDLVIEEKFRAPETIHPTHTLCLFSNHLPRVGSTDEGTWRRLIVIPFNARISQSEARANMAESLFREAGGAILSWAIQGAAHFIRNGCKLTIPDAVDEITGEYREREDWLENFLRERCVQEPAARESASELYAAYKDYAASVGDYCRRISDFNAALEEAGFQKIRPKNKATWLGVRLDYEYKTLGSRWSAAV